MRLRICSMPDSLPGHGSSSKVPKTFRAAACDGTKHDNSLCMATNRAANTPSHRFHVLFAQNILKFVHKTKDADVLLKFLDSLKKFI